MTPQERARGLFRIEPARHDEDDWHAVDCGAGDDELALFGSRAAAEAYVEAHAAPIASAIKSALAEQAAGEAERVREAVAAERAAVARFCERRAESANRARREVYVSVERWVRARATSPAPEPVADAARRGEEQAKAYLERIGATRAEAVDLDANTLALAYGIDEPAPEPVAAERAVIEAAEAWRASLDGPGECWHEARMRDAVDALAAARKGGGK